MRKILHGYIFRETAQTWLAVTGVLLSILLTDQIARVLVQSESKFRSKVRRETQLFSIARTRFSLL